MSNTPVESIARALAILRTFTDDRTHQTLSEIATRTGFYKSTVLRLTASLEAGDILRRGADRRYRLGPELWRLGALYRQQLDLGEFVRPVLARLVSATGETASFYVRDGDERTCLYRHNSLRPVRHHLDEGLRFPLDRGATGRVLLAFTSRDWPPGAEIRKRGYCVSLGERDPEVGAVAVPVIDVDGRVRGALAVSGLRSRFDHGVQMNALAALREETARLGPLLPSAG